MKKVLIVSKNPTHPTDAGNRQWILAQTETLKRMGCEVHFLYIEERGLKSPKEQYDRDLSETMAYWGDYFHLLKVTKFQKTLFNINMRFREFFCHWHYHVDDNYPWGLGKMVNRLDSKYHFDICIINYYDLSKLFTEINIPKKAIATHDVIAYKDIKIGEPILCITAGTEAKAMQRCPHIFALQTVEADYFQMLSPKSKVYNFFGKFEYTPQPVAGNHNMVFLSGGNGFNQNGIRWFLKEVFPVIRYRFADARLLIGGSICKAMPELRNYEGVEVQGFVDDPDAFYAQADVCINPCNQGTGLKIKTFEAISYDKVTMVHPHSMEGIYDKDHAPLFASDKPEEWVRYLESLWSSPQTIEDIKKRNKEYLESMERFVDSEYRRFLDAE
jgi:hypothetical protein